MKVAYYNVCPDCGAHLEPGEHCDCKERREELLRLRQQTDKERGEYIIEENNGQLKLAL